MDQAHRICGVFGHKINDVWNTLGYDVRNLLDEQQVLWTSFVFAWAETRKFLVP